MVWSSLGLLVARIAQGWVLAEVLDVRWWR
jgi:hypothetical protein